MWRVPEPLKQGDAIRIIAPSGAFDRQRFEQGVALLREAGLEVRVDDGVFARDGYLAGDDERRLAELRHALAESDTRAVWTARGGYGATRLLPHVPVDAVRRADKWLVGFSDATALHAVWARANLASIHGANVTTLASWSPEARAELLGMLTAPTPRLHRGRTLAGKDIVSGPLLGGNLTVLAALTGTGALPRMSGCVLFLEDIGEKPYRLDRELTQLRQAGALDGVVGFVIGQLTDCVEGSGPTALEVVRELLTPLGAPILADLAVGHEPSSRPLLLGGEATLDPVEGVLTLALPRAARTV